MGVSHCKLSENNADGVKNIPHEFEIRILLENNSTYNLSVNDSTTILDIRTMINMDRRTEDNSGSYILIYNEIPLMEYSKTLTELKIESSKPPPIIKIKDVINYDENNNNVRSTRVKINLDRDDNHGKIGIVRPGPPDNRRDGIKWKVIFDDGSSRNYKRYNFVAPDSNSHGGGRRRTKGNKSKRKRRTRKRKRRYKRKTRRTFRRK